MVLSCLLGQLALAADPAPAFTLAAPDAVASRFSDAQLAFVQSWIRQKAPDCPVDLAAPIARQFLEELQQRQPDKIDQLLATGFPTETYESMLLRHVAAKMTGVAQGPIREELARRRVAATLAAQGKDSKAAAKDAAALIEKLRDSSPTQYRRLVEGRLEEDDLQLQLRKVSLATVAPKELGPAKPKVLTSADIVSEFSRRNQVGSALQRLQAYTVEGRLTTPGGEQQELLLFRMRPDRFRLVVRSGGRTQYLMGFDGSRFWEQAAGRPAQAIAAQAIGERRFLGEFVDPLFAGEGYSFERKEDGTADGRSFFRIAVRRTDGSGYVARVDTETFRETGRETSERGVTHYADFREVAGVTYAFREEVTDRAGGKGTLAVNRITPNPGLIQDFFAASVRPALDYFDLERSLVAVERAPGN